MVQSTAWAPYSTGGPSHFKIYYTRPTPIYPLGRHLSTPLADTYIYMDSADVHCTVICVISTLSVLPTSTLKLTEGSGFSVGLNSSSSSRTPASSSSSSNQCKGSCALLPHQHSQDLAIVRKMMSFGATWLAAKG
ncbi:hypothetical protein PAXRUDRAFT_19740 [Paxillus rubicundulus Ve08.2h10]|uniref:Uncharacterized protein n=1 Tax=Paxillus rubicundulus Ve08.2h10 TaxID=930991 RepID=A0A0D0D3Q3_9AGAM|nr:hypothetical protein PAXRUDRAFT_19740 [Paxillus rubicundulus Ve08.2h10]